MHIGDTNAVADLEELRNRLLGMQEAAGVMASRINGLLNAGHYDARDFTRDLDDLIQAWTYRSVLTQCTTHTPACDSPIDAEVTVDEAHDDLQEIQEELDVAIEDWEAEQEEAEEDYDDDYDDDDDDDDGDDVGDGLEWYEARGEPGSPDRRQWLEMVVPGWVSYLEHYKNSPVVTTPIYTTIQQHLPAYQEELADLQARERLGL